MTLFFEKFEICEHKSLVYAYSLFSILLAIYIKMLGGSKNVIFAISKKMFPSSHHINVTKKILLALVTLETLQLLELISKLLELLLDFLIV